MSYILDSLKKAEQQRQQGQVPGLQSVHAADTVPSRRSPLIFWVVLVALVINAGLIVWWIAGKKAPVDAENPLAAANRQGQVSMNGGVRSALPPAVAVGPHSVALSPPVLPEPMAGSSAEASTGDGTEKKGHGVAVALRPPAPTAIPSQPTGEGRIPLFSELSEEFRRGLPQFTFSLHYYTVDPGSRMVRINNRNLRQGDILDGGVELQEITPEGVILSAQGERFRLVNE